MTMPHSESSQAIRRCACLLWHGAVDTSAVVGSLLACRCCSDAALH